MHAIAPRLSTHIDHGVADACRLSIENLIRLGYAHRHRVDQVVAVVAGVKLALPPHRRHANAIAIAANARHHAHHQRTGFGMAGIAKAQGV